MKLRFAVMVLGLGMLLGACGGSDGDGDGAGSGRACKVVGDEGTVMMCTEYVGSLFDGEFFSMVCPSSDNFVPAGSCPKGDEYIGVCKFDDGTMEEHHQYYYDFIHDGASAEEICVAMEGVWSGR